jgi:hypothetical protein
VSPMVEIIGYHEHGNPCQGDSISALLLMTIFHYQNTGRAALRKYFPLIIWTPEKFASH